MDSRLLNALNEQAGNTKDPVVWARAVCRAASHFARHGRSDQAICSIGLVRAQFKDKLHPEIASWLMLAEGVLHYFQARTHEAYDRIQRAYGLAVALKTETALPACAAWMAHLEFYDGKYDKMAIHLQDALTLAGEKDHQAKARATLVLAMSYHLADEYVLAKPWYEKARQHAGAEGDEATLSAMLHDVAAYRASNLRLIDSFGGDDRSEAHRTRMEAASSVNYDDAIDHQGLNFLTSMLQGLILTINKQYSEALGIFDRIDRNKVPAKLLPSVEVDVAWCLANSDRKDLAQQVASRVLNDVSDLTEDDELAYAYSRLSQVFAHCGNSTEATRLRDIAVAALERHRDFQKKLLVKLNNIEKTNKNPA